MGKGRILSRWKYFSSLTCASKLSDLKEFAVGMGVVPWVQHGHHVFKFRHELKYLTESLGVTFTVEQPLALNGLNRAMQSTANVRFSARLCMDKAAETGRWTGVKCIWASGEQPQLLMASAVIP